MSLARAAFNSHAAIFCLVRWYPRSAKASRTIVLVVALLSYTLKICSSRFTRCSTTPSAIRTASVAQCWNCHECGIGHLPSLDETFVLRYIRTLPGSDLVSPPISSNWTSSIGWRLPNIRLGDPVTAGLDCLDESAVDVYLSVQRLPM